MWIDPDQDATAGVLLSDRIKFYAEQVQLISPYQDRNLGPASYDLTLGTDCWYAEYLKETGQAKRILKPGENLILRPNSITFVSTAEELNLPFYLVARFNLKLRFLHEGLLLGTGPQIDPGFRGRLSCPIHNISSEKVSFIAGEPFAVIEFHKTSPFAQEERFQNFVNIDVIRRKGESRELRGLGGHPCITFPAKSLNREPVKRYVPAGRLVSSSVEGVEAQQRELQKTVDKEITGFKSQLSNVNIMAFFSVIAVAISLGTYFVGMINWNKSVHDSTSGIGTELKKIEEKNNALEQRIKDLEQKINQTNSNSNTNIKVVSTKNQTP